MRYPFHIKWLGYIDNVSKVFFLLLQFIKYYPVINSFYSYLFSIFCIVQFAVFPYKVSKRNDGYVQVILCTIKINSRFLFMGIYFKQDHIFNIMFSDNNFF